MDNIHLIKHSIAVNDVNIPNIGPSNTITENASPSTVIGTLSSVDLDTTTPRLYLADSGDAKMMTMVTTRDKFTNMIMRQVRYIYINVNDLMTTMLAPLLWVIPILMRRHDLFSGANL